MIAQRINRSVVAAGVLASTVLSGIITQSALAQCDPQEIAKLLADDGSAGDRFGSSVSVSGNTAIVGAFRDLNQNGEGAGSAYVFERVDGVWTQTAKLIADDGAAGDAFGWSVSVWGDTALIAAKDDDDNRQSSGSAYVFERAAGVWRQTAKLIPNDGARRDLFGWSVSISGDVALIGSRFDDDNGAGSGSAYVFTRTGGAWAQTAKLLADDGAPGDEFGLSVAVSGDVAMIGAADDDDGEDSGAVYVFEHTVGAWVQTIKLTANDADAFDRFGGSVSVSGDAAVFGARGDTDNGELSGSAYVFERTGGSWRQAAKLLPNDGATDDFFGESVSIAGTAVVIGAVKDDDNGNASGSVYVFKKIDGAWVQVAKLTASDGSAGDAFGDSVDLSGDHAVMGASWHADNGSGSGSAYMFDLNCPGTPARLTSFRILDGTLVSGGLPELRQSDDAWLETEARLTGEVAQPQLLRLRIVAESDVEVPTELDLTFEAHITDADGTVWLLLRDWDARRFVQVDQFAVGMGDEVYQVTITGARRFIRTSDGRITLQVKKIVFLPFALGGFHSLIDQVEIVVR